MDLDVLRPQLLWIGNRCYRVDHAVEQTQDHPSTLNSFPGYVEEDLYGEDDDDVEESLPIEETSAGRFKISCHVPQAFFAQIIGTKGLTRKRIEAETKTQIQVPKQGISGDIIITGSTRQGVSSAVRKINLIVLAGRERHAFTHFISVPCNNEDIVASFKKFKDEVMAMDPNNASIDSSLFQTPQKLHITIGTLTLMDNNDRVAAADVLQNCKQSLIDPVINEYGHQNMKFEVKGLNIMNDDESAVDVLYGVVHSEPLQIIANGIIDRFVKKGLSQKPTEHVKLHVTLMNTIFRDEKHSNSGRKHSSRRHFDARQILKNFTNYKFGVMDLKEIHLSQRFTTASDGYYQSTGCVFV